MKKLRSAVPLQYTWKFNYQTHKFGISCRQVCHKKCPQKGLSYYGGWSSELFRQHVGFIISVDMPGAIWSDKLTNTDSDT